MLGAAMGELHNPYNPYAPPTADEVHELRSEAFTYKSSEGLAAALRVMLGISVALLVISVASMSMQIELLQSATRGTITDAEAVANDQRVWLATLASVFAMIATGVVWCIWQNRTSKNVRALGGEKMQFGPNAWGWFFCPILNLWRPLTVITELWTATPGSDASPPKWLLAGWWLPWIFGSLFNRLSATLAKDTSDLDTLISASEWELAGDVLLAVSGVFAILFVTMLQKRVRARATLK
jgi:hypothetical protein